MWGWVVLGAAVLIAGAAGFDAAGSGSHTAAPTTTSTSTRDGSCPQPCANDNYGWIVSISNVRYDAQGSEFEKPEAGNVFVFLDLTFTNKLDGEQHANPTSFVLMDGAGVKHTWRPMLGVCPMWDPVNLTKGATLGPKCMAFEAAAGRPTGLVLVWTPSGLGGSYSIRLS